MTQSSRIFAVLESKGYITNRDFQDLGLLHVGRNRITEQSAKEYFLAKGKCVSECIREGDFLDHRWELRDIKISQGNFVFNDELLRY